MAMSKIDRIDREIEKTRGKITEYQNRLKELEAQLVFIFLDLQAHGSLGYELFIGSLCKVQIFGGGKKKWEPFDAHMNTSYRGKDVWHPSFFHSTIN